MSNPRSFLNYAAELARAKKDGRNYFFGAFGARADGTGVTAVNGEPKFPTPAHHCEARLCRKLDKGSIVYVARTLANGTWANAKPCYSCEIAMRSRGVTTVYYTIAENEYGTLRL